MWCTTLIMEFHCKEAHQFVLRNFECKIKIIDPCFLDVIVLSAYETRSLVPTIILQHLLVGVWSR